MVFQNQFIRHLKEHAFESYFSIWIISHSSQDRNQPKVNYEDRTKSFLTDGKCESAMKKTIALLGVTIINQLNDQNLMWYYIICNKCQCHKLLKTITFALGW